MKDRPEILERVAELYSDNLTQLGTSSAAVGWPDEDSHRLRFEKLAELLPGDMQGLSIADLGCGYGALYEFLAADGRTPSRYVGVDISEPMLATAKEVLPNTGVELVLGDRVPDEVDFTIASGIFNVRFDADDVAWEEHIFSTLDSMNSVSRYGFAFNLLSTYVDYRRPHLFYGSPLEFFDHCKRTYSPRVALLHDYPLYEWTILVRKS